MSPEILQRAQAYPYDAPIEGYVFEQGKIAHDVIEPGERTPVLAIGSNGSPEQLARKFGHDSDPIPVTRALVFDHVVVYSAHFTSYGSLPAMLHHYPGAHAYMFVTWLDARQLERMHETEILAANYRYEEHFAARVEVNGEILDHVGVYVSTRGPLKLRSTIVRLAEIASLCPALPRLTQRAVLRCVHQRLSPYETFETFIHNIVASESFRSEVNERLLEIS